MANGANGRDEVGITAPGGVGVALKGQGAIITAMLAAALVGVIYFSLDDHRKILASQNQLVAALRVQNWLLSLPPATRPQLPPPTDALKDIYGYIPSPPAKEAVP